jgi:alanyl-tRNA synthetase
MERAAERGRATAGGSDAIAADALYTSLAPEATLFIGYHELETATHVVALVTMGELKGADAVEAPNEVEVFLATTPFYPEGGGQVGDRGEITGPNGRIEVTDTQRVAERLIVHCGRVMEGRIAVDDEVTARVDPSTGRTNGITRRHTSCTRRCGRSSDRTCGRRGRSSRPTGCASTLRRRRR